MAIYLHNTTNGRTNLLSRFFTPAETILQVTATRLAIVGTPRSGNMWLRRLLSSVGGLEESSADTPAAVPWDELPDACVLQLHWPPTDEFEALLERERFRPVVLTRHPLDVLVSILHFAQHEPRTARWLNGEEGDERSLAGGDPCSAEFLAYATGPRARALLDVTLSWARSPTLTSLVSYENLVASPTSVLARVCADTGLEPVRPFEDAVAANDFGTLRAQNGNEHFWRGRPGLWRSLLPGDRASVIASAHAESLDHLGYELDPDPGLTEPDARANWAAIAEPVRPMSPAADAKRRLDAYLAVAALPPDVLTERVYSLVLRRDPDPDASERARIALHEGTLSAATLVRELVTSSEAEQTRAFDDAIAFATWARRAGERPRDLAAPPHSSSRLIEIPWTLARYRGESRVLDVGYAFAEPAYLAALTRLETETITAVDLAEVAVPGIETVTADVRRLPFPAESFDLVLCISTLEWIGSDNRVFGLPAERDPDGPRAALDELRRVLGPDGRVLLTVPCGAEQDLGWFVQHTREGWERLFAGADLFPFEEQVYELGANGWRPAGAFSSDGMHYAERGDGPSAILCAELRPHRRAEAVRRAIRRTGRRLRGEATHDR